MKSSAWLLWANAAVAASFVIVEPSILGHSMPKHCHDEEGAVSVKDWIERGFDRVVGHALHGELEDFLDLEEGVLDEGPEERPLPHNLTIYELISLSNHTTKFAKLVDKVDSIVQLLNSTKANHTLFVPIDAAFNGTDVEEKLAANKTDLEAWLKYHIALGQYPAGRLAFTPSIPTALNESLLGDKPQRLHIDATLRGLRVNFFTRVVAYNFRAENGVIHGLSRVLHLPRFVGAELTMVPKVFSKLLAAYERTDFVSFIHNVPLTGTTVFAPTNGAWERLGPHANHFLFETDDGVKYLRALLKYQIVANTTLYSNAIYDLDDAPDGDAEEPASPPVEGEAFPHRFTKLPTLLSINGTALPVLVDVTRLGPVTAIRVNHRTKVVARDVPAKNGVIQVVGGVPIPLHRHHHRKHHGKKPGHGEGEEAGWRRVKGLWMGGDGGAEMSVHELKERLDPFVQEEDTLLLQDGKQKVEGKDSVWSEEL